MSTTVQTRQGAGAGAALGSFAIDAALVTVFAAIGRGSHAREATAAGLFETAWPFVAGLAIAWLLSLAWRRPAAPLRTGIPVWIGAVALGMLFRALSGQGTALPFVIVATLTLLLLLVGWRLIAALVRRIRGRRTA
ncbi:DUF3054 domain-containing protein [Leucobacter albus]|uniref:DUF3054 domain-containing protein n=1 Tax=Leucobacter albus TaxID=272210 RepID=A0ABW3TPR8_9MICO